LIYWKEDNFWLGKLLEHPDIMTQGLTLEELEINFKDAYLMMAMGNGKLGCTLLFHRFYLIYYLIKSYSNMPHALCQSCKFYLACLRIGNWAIPLLPFYSPQSNKFEKNFL
jgi:hypothetical protein